jgi:hypothetical protein
VIRRGRQHLSEEPRVASRFQLEIRMTERVDHEVTDVPAGDAGKIQADPRVERRQQAEKSGVEDQLFGE